MAMRSLFITFYDAMFVCACVCVSLTECIRRGLFGFIEKSIFSYSQKGSHYHSFLLYFHVTQYVFIYVLGRHILNAFSLSGYDLVLDTKHKLSFLLQTKITVLRDITHCPTCSLPLKFYRCVCIFSYQKRGD